MGVVIERPAEVLGLGDAGLESVMRRTQPEGMRSGQGTLTARSIHCADSSGSLPPVTPRF